MKPSAPGSKINPSALRKPNLFLVLSAKTIAFFLFNLYLNLKVFGRKNVPQKGPFIIASNHSSYLDPVLVGFVCPRLLYYLAKADLFEHKVLGRLVGKLGALPLSRYSKTGYDLIKALDVLKNNGGLLLYPEGTRGRGRELLAAKPGIGFLALKTGCPVVPVFIEGAYRALNRDARFLKPAAVKIMIGAPQVFKEGTYEETASAIMREIEKLKIAGRGDT